MEATYDAWLVSLSIIIAIGASFVALTIAARIPHVHRRALWIWLGGGAISMGLAIWSMHFVGMLAFHIGTPLAYDIELTLLSILYAIAATGLAFFLVRMGYKNITGLSLATFFMGSGIAAMHYTGMDALKMAPPIVYDPPLFIASLVIAYSASFAALRLFFIAGDDPERSYQLLNKDRAWAALVMGLAIAGMHYTGMEAAIFAPGSICLAVGTGISPGILSVLIVLGVISILIFTLILLIMDMKVVAKDHLLLEQLRKHNKELEARAHELSLEITKEIRERSRKDRLLATVVEQTADAIVTVDNEDKITSWNKAAKQTFGYSQDDVYGKYLELLFPVDKTDDELNQCSISTLGQEGEDICTGLSKTGTKLTVAISSSLLKDEHDIPVGKILILRDVTSQKKTEAELKLMASVFEHSAEGILITDDKNHIISINDAYSKITGYQPNEVIGKDPGVFASGKHGPEFYEEMWQTLLSTDQWQGEIWNKRKNNDIYPQLLTISLVRDDLGNVTNHIGIFTDIARQKAQEEHIQFMASHDSLTGLPNRNLLNDRIHQAFANAKRHENKVAVIFMDLDHFKNINDTLGHEVGDLLLKEVALRLQDQVREMDTVCRFGGDEFVLLLTELKQIGPVISITENFITAISNEYQIGDNKLLVTPSIGISIYPDDGHEATLIIRQADTAMYHAKRMGRGNFQFYTHSLNEMMAERMLIEQALREAINNQEFSLHYQPQITLSNEKVAGLEALIRWSHPELGQVSPAVFIPIAEEIGLIQEIGYWVLKEVSKTISEWRNIVGKDIRIALNISVKQLNHADFVAQIMEQLNLHELDSSNLELEITESVLMDSIEHSSDTLDALHNAGFPLAMDDFGTGFSSLSYLRKLSFDALKIDRSFIMDLTEDKDSQEIINAIIAMAHGLGISVIAEGVETQEQIQYLKAFGCDEVQGYYYSKPLPKNEAINYLSQKIE